MNLPRTLWLAAGWFIIAAIIQLSLFTTYVPQPTINHGDKLHHFIAYGTLMLWFAQAYQGKTRLQLAFAFIALGVLIEFIQPITGREFSLLDMLANSIGVGLGYFIAYKGGDLLYTRLTAKNHAHS